MSKSIKNKLLLAAILLGFLVISELKAQTIKPGGTNLTTELWLSADKLQTSLPQNGSPVTNWVDRSGNNVNFGRYNNDGVPVFVHSGLNFHPAVEFETTAESGGGSTAERRIKLATSNRFNIDNNKSYYAFYVSTVNSEQSDTNASVFTYVANENTSQGWSKTGPAMWLGEASNYRVINTSLSYESGIGVSYRSNSTSNFNELYFNGIPNTSKAGRLIDKGGTSSRAIIGTSTTTAGNFFYGQVQEIIVLSAPVNNPIDRNEVAKVNSYLAVKYGIGLEGGANYVNSAGNNIWTNSKNTGYTSNIFGIGRDDKSGLYQKQGSGMNNRSLAVFLGDNLESLNLENKASLTDNTYLLMGSNGRRDNTSYVHPAGTQFKEGVSTLDVNFRQNLVYKVQLTGESNLSVNMSTPGRYLLVSENDPSFAPQNTRLYPVVDGIAKDVVVKDGDFIGFALFEIAPGGVFNGLKLWLRADEINSLSLVGDKVDVWRDQTSNSNNYSFSAVSGYSKKSRPTYIACDDKMNYKPALLFDIHAYLAKLGGPMSVGAPDDFISFVVYHSTDYNSTRRLYTHGFGSTNPDSPSRYPAMGFSPAKGVGRLYATGSGGEIEGRLPGYRRYATALHMIHTRKAATPGGRLVEHDFGGWRDVIVPSNTVFGNNFQMARGSTLGGASYSGTGSNSGSFQGLISEVFFYEKDLSEDERNKIRTYLAIKYGITLDADDLNPEVNADYILSDGVTAVWRGNSSPNKRFHKNVVGLVRDDTGDLYNNKAKSSGDGGIVTMMLPEHSECGQGRKPGLVKDLSALFWGHNSATREIQLKDNPDVCGEMDFRTERIWLVNKTNLPTQEVTIRIGASTDGFFPYNSASYQVYFLVAKSEEDLHNNKWESAIPASFVEGEHQLNYTFSEEYTYFSLGVKPLPGSCTAADFKGTKTLVFTKNTWADGDLTRDFNLGDGFNVKVTSSIASPASFYNRYPRSSSQNSLREYRRGNASALMTTELSLSKAAKASFQIFEIDRSGELYDEVEVYGMCGNTEVRAKLSYSVSPKRSSYEIFGKNAKAKKSPTSSYTSNNGKMYVEFEYPVEKIIIKHKATGKAVNGSQRIGIGPISFSTPQPLPPTNEDGLIFVKEVSPEVFLCEEVLFTYRIVNANCAPKTVSFTDVLPHNMTWVSNSLSIEETAYPIDDNSYADTNLLDLKNILVPGGETLVFRAKAVFDMSAAAGTYNTGKARIEYQRIVNDLPYTEELLSCDGFISGCESSIVTALETPDRPLSIELENYDSSDFCYREESEILFSMTVNNPNPFTIPKVSFEVSFNAEFAYISGSLTSQSLAGLSDPVVGQAILYVENLSLTPGEHSISFKLKAPKESELKPEVDEEGNLIYLDGKVVIAPLEVFMEMFSETEDICVGTTLSGVNVFMPLPYCSSKKAIISNKMISPKVKK